MSKKNKNRKPSDAPADPSLRDYFAGLSLQALLYADEESIDIEALRKSAPSYAERAYLIADAMIAARGESEELEDIRKEDEEKPE
ncbi:MAG: hypothetical protein ACO1SV_23540 [Fimbriimonas sp.]